MITATGAGTTLLFVALGALAAMSMAAGSKK
jgi:hypothetical protein